MSNRVCQFAVVALFLLASCSALHPRHAQVYAPNEIAGNPAILHDGSVPFEQMTLRGVHLGDAKGAIPSSRILKESPGGWIVCTDGSRYQIRDGAVAILGVWDRSILDQLHLTSQAEIEARFGKPEATEAVDPIVIYRYRKGKINVLWNKVEQQVNAVNVIR